MISKKSKVSTANEPESMDKWRAESDARTLVEAAEIKKDKERYAAAIKYSQTIMQKHKGIAQDAATESIEGDDEDGDE